MNTTNPMQWMEDIQKNISDLIARSPAADVERNVRAMMTQGFSKLDLVTREEFDVQADLLARTLTRVDQLAAQVTQLEARVNALEARPVPFVDSSTGGA
jgi:BMFP domain-containing protein YqiC